MSVVTCTNCGGVTNTAVCRHIVGGKMVPVVECYARFEGEKWVRGCGYDHAPTYMREALDQLIADQPQQRQQES